MARKMSLDNCLAELATLGRDTVRHFTDFMNVHPATAMGWILGYAKAPAGEALLRFELYCHLRGWQIAELAQVSTALRPIGRYWAAGVVTPTEFKTSLGHRINNDNQALIDMATGRHAPTATGLANVAQLLDKHRLAYRQRLTELREQYRLDLDATKLPKTTTGDPPILTIPAQFDDQAVLDMLVNALNLVAPLARHVDELDSDDNREAVRQAVGPDKFFVLTTDLNRISGWRTRQQLTDQATLPRS